MKRIFLGTLFFLVYAAAVSAPPIFKEGLKSPGSVTVGDSTAPNTKAVLDLKSVTKGVLFPRMTTAQRNAIASPPEGLVVYDTSINAIFQYDGSAWRQVASDGLSPNFSGLILGSGTGPLKATGGTVGTGDIDLSSEVTGTLAVSAGGTGTGTTGANLIFAGPTSGGNAAPSFRSLVADDIPGLDASKITSGTIGKAFGGTGIDNSSVTFPTAGTVATTTGTTFLNNLFTNPTANLLTLVSQDTPPTPPSVFSKYNLYVDEPTRKLVLQDATGNEVPIGSGGGGPKNLLKFPDFENGGTTGWLTGTLGISNGNPSGTPLFGFNATALIQGIGTGAAIEGSWSLWYIISSASVPGDFTSSIEIAIDENLRTKLLKFRFSYKIVSGASNGTFGGTNSDSFGVAAYDVTNSKWIPISQGQFCFTQVLGVGDCVGYFQVPYGAETIRFIPIYNANATSGAVSVYLDDFYLGPDDILTPQVSKPIAAGAYRASSPQTITAGGTIEVALNTIRYDKTGTALATNGRFTATEPGLYEFDYGLRINTGGTAPSSVTTYLRKNGTGEQLGFSIKTGGFSTNSSYPFKGSAIIDLSAGDYVSSWVNPVAQDVTVGETASANDVSYMYVKKLGEGGSGLASGPPLAVTLSRATSDQTGVNPNNSAVKVQLNNLYSADNLGWVDLANNRIVFARAGKFAVSASTSVAATNVLNSLYSLQVWKNGSGIFTVDNVTPSVSTAFALSGPPVVIDVNAGDYIELYLFGSGDNSSNTLTIAAGTMTRLSVVELLPSGGPGLQERVHFDAYTTNATIGTSLADVVFGTEVEDSHGWYDHTTGVFTAGKPLLCDFGWSISTQAATLSTTERFVSILYLNSAIKRIGSRIIGNGASNAMTSAGPAMGLKLNAGDQVKIQAVSSQSVAGSTNANEVSFSGNCVAH